MDAASSAEPEICAGCHRPLNRRGPQGECLRCALGLIFDGEEESSAAPTGENQSESGSPAPGVLRYGHFEVARGFDGLPVELGSGAMATTYRAHDTVLRTPVALKIISQNVVDNPAARARFLREARATARLHHPNVASVTFYGEEAGHCFYAMELVEGETLEARVHRAGVFTPGQTMEVGVQVARALAAAEACGVVHRDLKPSNLMLTSAQETTMSAGGKVDQANPSLHVKVIDWGLAKAISAEDLFLGADQTRGGFVGTPAFASPEQFSRASERRIDTRSDIYSLGVTLWYLLCGKVPFVGDTLEAIHARQRELPLAQLKAAKVPGDLTHVLKSMVAFDPAGRPQSARELLDVLRRCQERYTGNTRAVTLRRRWARLSTGVVTLALLFAGAEAWRRHRKASTELRPEPTLAVLPFSNLSPDQADAFFTAGMQDEIAGDLARAPQLKVLSPGSTRNYQAGQPRDYAAIGRALSAGHLLEGSVRRADGQVSISVRLVDANRPANAWEQTYHGPLGGVLGLQSQIETAVTEHLQTPLSAKEKIGLAQTRTVDPQAHDLYLRARAMDQPGVAHFNDIKVGLDEVALLKAAVARDPTFVRAFCDLSVREMTLNEIKTLLPIPEQAVDHRGLADIALAQARRLAPDAPEVHLAKAHNIFLATHDADQARQEIDLARRALPNDEDVEHMSGEIAYAQGHWQEALRYLERAVALDPLDSFHHFFLAEYERHLRRYDEYDREMTQVIATMPGKGGAHYELFRDLGLLEGRANLQLLRANVPSITPEDDPTGRLRFLDTFLLNLFDRDADTAAHLVAGYNKDPVRHGTHLFPKAWYEAQIARLRGDDRAARTAFVAAREWMDKQVAANPGSAWMLSMLAVFDAGLGNKEDAVREALRAAELEPDDSGQHNDASFVRGNLALVYAWNGQPELALDTLQSLADKPGSYNLPAQPSYGDLKLNPAWDSLRSNPRFEPVLQRFAKPVSGS